MTFIMGIIRPKAGYGTGSGENHWTYRLKGKKHPLFGKKCPEHSERMSGENHPMFGKGHLLAGENNGMFGKGHLLAGENNGMFGRKGEKHHHFGKKCPEHSERMSGEKHPQVRPEYAQARWFFFVVSLQWK